MESKRVFFVAQMAQLHSGKRPLEDVWILLKMGDLPACYVSLPEGRFF